MPASYQAGVEHEPVQTRHPGKLSGAARAPEKGTALAHAALTVMREQRDDLPASDGELVVGVLLEMLERRDDLRGAEEGLIVVVERSSPMDSVVLRELG